jgi:restriction system protein
MPIKLSTTLSGEASSETELLIPFQLLETRGPAEEGKLVTAISPAWMEIFEQLKSDPELIYRFSTNPQAFEEFIAASYDKAGFKVTLTPRSGDLGRDIIAEKPGFISVRIIDQCKAYKKGHVVSPNDVRAVMGVLGRDQNASKAVLTTTSTFAPSVAKEWQETIPNRLELRDGKSLLHSLSSLKGQG